MSQTRRSEEQPKNRNHTALCGALGSDITRAVEIISIQNEIPGSLAYRLLVQEAANAQLSIHEIAGVIAQSRVEDDPREPPDRDLAG